MLTSRRFSRWKAPSANGVAHLPKAQFSTRGKPGYTKDPSGGLTEWPKVVVLKTTVSARAPRVRISYPPRPASQLRLGGLSLCGASLCGTGCDWCEKRAVCLGNLRRSPLVRSENLSETCGPPRRLAESVRFAPKLAGEARFALKTCGKRAVCLGNMRKSQSWQTCDYVRPNTRA